MKREKKNHSTSGSLEPNAPKLDTDTYHDGPEAASSSLPLQSHPGYGPQGIFIHIKVTLKQTRTGVMASFTHPTDEAASERKAENNMVR